MKLSRPGPSIASDPQVAALVPPEMAGFLASASPDVVRFIVENGSDVEGIILARRKAEGELRILCLNTREKAKRKAIATILVQELMGWAKREGLAKLVIAYSKSSPDAAFLEEVLGGGGWSGPTGRTILFRTTPEKFLEAPFMNRRKLPTGYRICRWDDLGEDQLEAFRVSQEKEGWIPEDLHPDRFVNDCDRELSLAFLREEKVVGYQITHRRGNTLHFSCGWVHPELVGRGRIWNLAREIFERMAEMGIPFGEQRVPVDRFPETAEFLRKRQQPFAVSFVETLGMEWEVPEMR